MKRSGYRDVGVGAALCVVAAAYLAWTVHWTQPPFEDAAMLLRYAVHVASGHGMVWNVGDAPLDGATDLLFTLAVAGAMHLGVSVEAAARLIGVVAHLVTVFLVYMVPRRLYGASMITCAIGALFLAVGPAKSYISAEFGTTFFAAWVAIAWAVALDAAETGSRRAEVALPIVTVMLGVARPEGAILGASFLLAVAIYRGGADGRRLLTRSALTFFSLGVLYFLGRWRYFGHPFPNPFYVKGGHVFFGSLRASVANVVRLVGPFLPLLALGLYSRATARRLVLVSVPIGVFISAWILLSDEMNYNMRFQYAVVPLVLMTWPGLMLPLEHQWRRSVWPALAVRPRVALLAAVAIVAGLVGVKQHSGSVSAASLDGRRDIGELLAAYQSRNYTVVVSEAGLLPFYSGWKAIDAWGLNDAEIARTGRVTNEYLDRFDPALISFHAYFSTLAPPNPATSRTALDVSRWDQMTLTLYDYAETRGYHLAACFGLEPGDAFFYYVRPDLPDAQRIIDAIRSTRYYYWNRPAMDFARARTGTP